MNLFGFKARDTQVPCPSCGDGTLLSRRSCLQVIFTCGHCERTFLLAELSRRLDDDAFAVLAEVVGDRFSDRV